MASANPAVPLLGAPPRVNLMPRAETERRERSALAKRWAAALLAAVVLVGAASAGAFWLQFSAGLRLATENTRTTMLLGQLAALSDVRQALDLETELVAFRADAMANDLSWSRLLATVQQALPPGVSTTGFSLTPGGIPQGEDPAAEIGATGTVTLTSTTPAEIVPIIRALRAVPGVLEADGWQVMEEQDAYSYELRIAVDQSVYTGAYAGEEAE
jgi:hypothetical protein